MIGRTMRRIVLAPMKQVCIDFRHAPQSYPLPVFWRQQLVKTPENYPQITRVQADDPFYSCAFVLRNSALNTRSRNAEVEKECPRELKCVSMGNSHPV
jgi:hypothetical protein